MLKSFTLLVGIMFAAFGCAASAEDTEHPGDDHAAVVCHDARYERVFDQNEHACRAYLDACLGRLTPAQRETWDARVDTCIQGGTAECLAEVPWC